MQKRTQLLEDYREELVKKEYSQGTVEKYLRDMEAFCRWLENQPGHDLTRENILAWKEYLIAKKYAPVTINSMLSSLNHFLRFLKREELKVRFLRIQRQTFRPAEKNLTKQEFERLKRTARMQGDQRMELLLDAMAGTGIRVSEVKYLTVEALRAGKAEISLKGKIRTILLPGKLRKRLKEYAKAKGITAGEIFCTRTGKSLSRRQIWREMKRLCKAAQVSPEKVFPHNLRHLFAAVFYNVSRDIVKLADVLGHSSVETTRIYLRTAGEEHLRLLERMRLIC